MEHQRIEVKLLCAKDLKNVNVFSKMDVYVIGSVSGDPRSIQRTMVDKDGGPNPRWNHEMKFTFDESAARMNRLGLVFQIMSNRTLGDKEVGRVYVPLKELFNVVGVGDETAYDVIDQERKVVYQVQTTSGKFKGQLEFCFKFGEKFTLNIERKLDEPVMAYPAVNPNVISGFRPTPVSGPTPTGGAAPYKYEYQPHDYRQYGYGYGYQTQCAPSCTGYGYGYTGGYGYAGQAPTGYMQQPAAQKPKKSKFGLGAAAAIGAGLLGGLLVGEMVEDVAETVAYDDMLEY